VIPLAGATGIKHGSAKLLEKEFLKNLPSTSLVQI
jgi:hypothetical protein